ncbi:MAG: hypothetical protein IH624_07020 [Phycisphaerae bacterium]|nr:hypothetical protein [Phycisphaerae bacterium]
MDNTECLQKVRRLGRVWFYFCTGCLLVWPVLFTGEDGSYVFSAMRSGTVLVCVLAGLAAAVTLHRFSGGRRDDREHPITNSGGYTLFYSISPLVGGVAGGLVAAGGSEPQYYAGWIAAGSYLAGVLVWLLATPLLYAAEMLLPSSRRHRAARLACARTMRRQAHSAKERALAELEATELKKLETWNHLLQPRARELAGLAITGPTALERNRGKIVDIGIEAWQIGGVSCMRHLHAMAAEVSKKESGDTKSIDLIVPCWDGIGNW